MKLQANTVLNVRLRRQFKLLNYEKASKKSAFADADGKQLPRLDELKVTQTIILFSSVCPPVFASQGRCEQYGGMGGKNSVWGFGCKGLRHFYFFLSS
jgi:hypothetical protein